MAADLVTRLWLDSKGFDGNIDKALSHLYKLKREGEKGSKGLESLNFSFGGVMKTVGKYAGMIGIASSAMDVFEKGIGSNAHLQDSYQVALEGSSTAVSQFFSSIYSGDWTVFNDGILTAIKNAKNFAKQYSDVMKMLDVTSARYERVDAEKNRLESIVEDENRSLAERKQAQQQLDRILIMGIADIREDATNVEKYLQGKLKQLGVSGDMGSAQRLLEDLYDPTSKARQDAEKYRNARKIVNRKFDPTAPFYSTSEKEKERAEAVNLIYKEYSEADRKMMDAHLRIIDSLTEEEYQKYKELFDRRSDLVDKAGTWEKDRSGARDEIRGIKLEGGPTATTPSKVVSSSSLQFLKNEISQLKKDYENAADDGTRAGLKKAISSKETQLTMMQLRSEMMNPLSGSSFAMKGRNATDDIASGRNSITAIEPISLIETDTSALDYVSAMGDLIGNLSGVASNAGAAWLQYSANIISSVGAMLPALASLFGIEAALGISEQAKIPFPLNIVAMAATAAGLVAAIASIPKFADGGIVGGHSFYGDKVPAMVNSGEMILNQGQQANLFRMLNGGGGRATNVQISGRLVAHGRDLVAVIDNQNNFNNRVR